jgi:hypothetical protein
MLALHADWTRFTLAIPTARQLGGTTDGLQTFADDGRGNTRLRSGLAWQWQLGEAHFLQAGLERERRNTAEYQLRDAASGALLAVQLPAESRYETAGWLQFDGRFGDWRAVLGLRHVDSEVFGQRWLPRGSLLWQASERQSWRLVFSEGYNAPTPLQRNVAIPPDALRGNPELRPEAVRNLGWPGAGRERARPWCSRPTACASARRSSASASAVAAPSALPTCRPSSAMASKANGAGAGPAGSSTPACTGSVKATPGPMPSPGWRRAGRRAWGLPAGRGRTIGAARCVTWGAAPPPAR